MNLIEKYGSYDKAKECAVQLSENLTDKQKNNSVFMNAFNALNNELLEYRRQHNIFEVGDKAVIRRKDGHPEVFTYEGVSSSGNMHFFESPYNYGHLVLCKVRHATNEEIKAGKRLEVNDGN